jgi:putative membrane protein
VSELSAPQWHRLHPAMLLFLLAGILRRYFLLFVVGGVASSRGENFVNFVLFSTVTAITVGLLRYLSYRYSISSRHLTVAEGVFTKRSRRYLLDKINHVNRYQNPLAKVMGIVKLELQQEASNIPALILPAVTVKQAEEIEKSIQDQSLHVDIAQSNQTDGDQEYEEKTRLLYQGTVLKSVVEGVSSLPLGIFMLIGVLYRFYGRALTPYIIDEYHLYVKTLSHIGISQEDQFWQFTIVSVVCLYIIALSISLVTAIVRWFRYRVVHKSKLIVIASGFFTRSTRVINTNQIQTIVGTANPIRRTFELCQWQIVAPRPGGRRGRASYLLPVGKNKEISGLLPSIWRSCEFPALHWLSVDSYQRRRLWLLNIACVASFLSLVMFIDYYFNASVTENLWYRLLQFSVSLKMALIIAFGLLLLLLHHFVKVNYDNTGYYLEKDFLFIKSAFLSQHIFVVPLEKIQAIIFNRSIMQVRRGLVTVDVDINGWSRPVRLYNISSDIAEHIRSEVVHTVNEKST